MAKSRFRATTKASGGKYKKTKGKKLKDLAGEPTLTKWGEKRIASKRVRGGMIKFRVLRNDIVNVYNPKTKKHSILKIESVIDNPANRHFVRRNIITKGTIVKTKEGNAKITSRPGQEGYLNAVLV